MTTWRERIQAARERGEFTRDDVRDAGAGEHPYAKCAVGEQADRVGAGLIFTYYEPTHPRCGVLDDDLAALGGGFLSAVSGNNFARAESLLDAIEDRALALKRGFRDGASVSPEPSDGGGQA